MSRKRYIKKQPEQSELVQGEIKESGQLDLGILSSVFFVVVTSIIPLCISRMGYFFITKERADFFVFFTLGSVILPIIALLITAQRFRPVDYLMSYLRTKPLSIPEWALLAFILLALLSSIFSPWQDFVWSGFTTNGTQGRWEGFRSFLSYGLAFFLIARFYRPQQRHFLIFSASVILISLYGVLQFLGFDILVISSYVPKIVQYMPLTRMFRTTLGNTNVVSAYCSLVIVLFAALYSTSDNSKRNYLYLAASVLSFALLLICKGKAGYVGVLVTMVLLIPYWLSDRQRLGKIFIVLSIWCVAHSAIQFYLSFIKQRSALRPLRYEADQTFLNAFVPFHPVPFIVLAAVLLIAGLCLLFLLKKWPQRFLKIAGVAFLGLSLAGGLLFVEIAGARRGNQPQGIVWEAREILHGRLGDSLGTYRGWIWKAGLSVIKKHPFLGTGPDTYFFALGGRQTARILDAKFTPQSLIALDGMQQEAMKVMNQWIDKAHNTYLQIAVCMGLPALFAYLIFLGALFLPSIKRAFKEPLLFAFGAGAFCYLVQCFFQVDTPIDRPLLYIVLGVMAVELSQKKVASENVPEVKETA